MEKAVSYFDWQLSFKKRVRKSDAGEFAKMLTQIASRKQINLSASIPESAVLFEVKNFSRGILKGSVSDASKRIVPFELNAPLRKLVHPCLECAKLVQHKKGLCRHLVRVLVVLRERDPKAAIRFVRGLVSGGYEFSND